MYPPWMNGSSQEPKAMVQHHMIHVGDVKPRLTKEQHDILEAHFRQQHKPTTQTKKGFAESLGVPLDKINNWFQNRRAKVKQDAKKLANAQSMFQQQMMAHQLQNGNAASQHPDFLSAQPHLDPSAFPMESADPNFMMHHQHQQNMLAASGVMPEPRMISVAGIHTADMGMATKPSFMAFDQSPEYTYGYMPMTNVQDFAAMHGDMSNMDNVDFAFVPGAPMQVTQSNGSTPSIPSTLSSMQSQSTMPSSTGGMSMPTLRSTEWSEDNKPTICFSDASDSVASAQAAYCSPPEDNSTAHWVSQQPPFTETASPPENIERPGSSQNFPPTPPDTKPLGELELPPEAFSRRASSTQELSESMGNVDIQTRSSSTESGFKQPGEPSRLAARRQRPSPAALGPAALRSASYSAGMPPTSPGSSFNNLSAPDQQLRRIRSGGIPGISASRVQKQSASGQRSPLHMNFADAADSPKFSRHASAYTALPSPGMQSLAPPTPLTPAEGNRFPSWQSYGSVHSHQNSVDHSSPNGIAVSWTTDSPALFQSHNVSSPPETPLDPMQAAQYNNWAHANTLHRDTPPQSAPAFQQCFNPALAGGTMAPEPSSLTVNAAHLGHIRRPSLPEQGRMMPPQAPMYSQSTNVPVTYSTVGFDAMPHMPPQPPATLPSQTTAAFPTPPQPAPASIPTSSNILPADFAVHEYLPPGAQSNTKTCASPPAMEHASGPKMFHFSNTGPKDFAGQP